MAAFHAALRVPGCDGLELDVRASRDGVPVVIHDDSLERVQHRPGRPADLTADELGALGVPTLADVLAAIPHRAFLDVELKEDLGRRVMEVLAAGRGPSLANAAIASFDPGALRRLGGLAASWPRWLNARDAAPATIALAVDLGCSAIALEWHAIDERSVERARREDLDVVGWTVVRRPTFNRLAHLGVRAVCVEGPALDG